MYRKHFIGLLALMITACGDKVQTYVDVQDASGFGADIATEAAPAPQLSATSRAKQSTVPVSPPQPDSQNPIQESFLAYRYNFGFSLPARHVASSAKSHAKMCQDAGPEKCQLLNSSITAYNEDNVTANLSLRAEPQWLKSFEEELKSSVDDAKGKMVSNSVNAEDLTRQILDTDARLNAQKTLRDRLQRLLVTRDAKLNDLLALEREFARVQSEIESATMTLGVLRKRVSMSVVNIHYQSQSVAVSQSALAPIGRALKGFVGGFSRGLANVINFLAAILPWLILVILPALWILRRWWRTRKQKP